MSQVNSSRFKLSDGLLAELRESQFRSQALAQNQPDPASKTPSFIEHLENGIDNVNQVQKHADQKATDLATGKSDNIHETMLATAHAELTFNLMVQIRNKALEAYQEIMRMPV